MRERKSRQIGLEGGGHSRGSATVTPSDGHGSASSIQYPDSAHLPAADVPVDQRYILIPSLLGLLFTAGRLRRGRDVEVFLHVELYDADEGGQAGVVGEDLPPSRAVDGEDAKKPQAMGDKSPAPPSKRENIGMLWSQADIRHVCAQPRAATSKRA
eukprot:scaffold345272_cov32-Prasinocladus_malaysianus.AAC.1